MNNLHNGTRYRKWLAIGIPVMIVLTIAAVLIGYRIGQVTDKLVQAPDPVEASPSTQATESPSESPTSEQPEPTGVAGQVPSEEGEEADSEVSPSSSPTSSGETAGEEPSVEPSTPATATPSSQPSETPKANETLRNKYEGQFASLRSSCLATVDKLSGEVVSYINSAKAAGKSVTVSDLQKQFLSDVSAAEGDCDQRFESTLASAKKDYAEAGADTGDLDGWSSQYSANKGQARMKAMSKVLAAWGAGSE